MFGSKKDKNKQFASGGHTLFDHALEVTGTVRFAGTLDIEGSIIGDVIAEEGLDALIRLRDRGVVNGDISAPKIVINGHVSGNIYCSTHIELAANAVVNGDVHYHVIEMVKGAKVNGKLVHNLRSEDDVSAELAIADSVPEITDIKQSEKMTKQAS